MSWDLMLFDFSGKPPVLGELPEDYTPPSMGDPQAVRDAVSAALPDMAWTDPARGVVKGDGWSIEFSLRTTGQTNLLTVRVRGSGDPIPTIVDVCKANTWSAFDVNTGHFLDLDNPSTDGWAAFQALREEVASTGAAMRKTSFITFLAIILLIILIALLFAWFQIRG